MKRVLIALAMAGSLAASYALEITLEPGKLQEQKILLETTHEKSLVLTGTANVTDLALLPAMSRSIESLDMSGLKLEAYTYAEGDFRGQKSFAEGELPAGLFMSSKLGSLALPADLKSIGASAFAGSALQSLEVPATVEIISDYAFSHCAALESVKIQGKAQLGKGLFQNACNLKNVELGFELVEVPESMFDGCSAYAAGIPAGARKIGAYAFRGTALKTVNLSQVESIGDYAFSGASELAQIVVGEPHDVTLGRGVFFHNDALKTLPELDGLCTMLFAAHSGAVKTVQVNVPVVAEGALANSKKVNCLMLGKEVKSLEKHAFRNLEDLQRVDVTELEHSVPSVDELCFSGLENEEGRYDITLLVADDKEHVWSEHPVWSKFNILNQSAGVEGAADAAMAISIERTGDRVVVNSANPVDFLGVYTLGGLTLHESAPGTLRAEAALIAPEEVVLVKVASAGQVKIAKLK